MESVFDLPNGVDNTIGYADLKREFGLRLMLLDQQMQEGQLNGESMVKYIHLLMIMLAVLYPGAGSKIRTAIQQLNPQLITMWKHVNLTSERGVKFPPMVVEMIGVLTESYFKRIDHVSLSDFLKAVSSVDAKWQLAGKKAIREVNETNRKIAILT